MIVNTLEEADYEIRSNCEKEVYQIVSFKKFQEKIWNTREVIEVLKSRFDLTIDEESYVSKCMGLLVKKESLLVDRITPRYYEYMFNPTPKIYFAKSRTKVGFTAGLRTTTIEAYALFTFGAKE